MFRFLVSAVGTLLAGILFLLAFPSFIAVLINSPRKVAICRTNLLGGLIFGLGWVIAMEMVVWDAIKYRNASLPSVCEDEEYEQIPTTSMVGATAVVG